ncbi:hypothetical protein EMCRGX_G033254 [Ephydatia muelleri]
MARKVDLKIVLLGERSCGKTALLERLSQERFEHRLPKPTEPDAYVCKSIRITGGRIVTLGIWDTSAKNYEAMAKVYYRGADVAIICFDLTNDKSFQKAKFWMNELKVSEEKCAVYLCGTKHDLQEWTDDVATSETNAAMAYADEMSTRYIETSSKTGHNVEKLFQMIVEDSNTVKPLKPEKISTHKRKGSSNSARAKQEETIASPPLSDTVVAVAVDEVHCVCQVDFVNSALTSACVVRMRANMSALQLEHMAVQMETLPISIEAMQWNYE